MMTYYQIFTASKYDKLARQTVNDLRIKVESRKKESEMKHEMNGLYIDPKNRQSISQHENCKSKLAKKHNTAEYSPGLNKTTKNHNSWIPWLHKRYVSHFIPNQHNFKEKKWRELESYACD